MIQIPGKIPLTIHPLFWLVSFFIGWMWTMSLMGSLICLGVIFFSVLFHEMGHALAAISFGQKTRIELAAFGGFTYREGRKLKLWEEFLVVVSGPIAGLLLAIGAYLLYQSLMPQNELVNFALRFTFIANFFWTIINLVPVLPLDGGHLLSILLEALFGFRGIKYAIIVGLIIAVGISLFFFIFGMFLLGALFLILTFESFRSLRYYKIFNEKDRDTDLQELMKEADLDFAEGRVTEAEGKLSQIRDKTREGIIYTIATQELAEIYKEQKKYKEGYELLNGIRDHVSGEYIALLHFLAYMNEDYEGVVRIANRSFQDAPSYNTALINALAYGALGRVEPAVGWLECALREGLPSLTDALNRIEFDPIRENPLFKKFEQE